ncbi:MAG: type IV pilus modification protein PilV [Variovorax sp.]|nr:type IV pilus modification protein PilV [Variovorax sp.]
MLNQATSRRSRQSGITLLESLTALLILALAVLGMLAVQLRTLSDTQTGVRRAQAVRLIEDLAERIKSNPEGFGQLASYTSDWSHAPTASHDCMTNACNATQLADWDLATWKDAVAETLPLGQAHVFKSTDENAQEFRRQLGVMVAWRANERKNDDALASPLQPDTDAAGVTCPANQICHLVYVQP